MPNALGRSQQIVRSAEPLHLQVPQWNPTPVEHRPPDNRYSDFVNFTCCNFATVSLEAKQPMMLLLSCLERKSCLSISIHSVDHYDHLTRKLVVLSKLYFRCKYLYLFPSKPFG